MAAEDTCPECGVPRHISSEHMWLNSGAIVQSRDSRNRMVFIESGNLDPLFRGIKKIIGIPIEHIVTTAKRKAVRSYLGSLIPEMTKQLLQRREIDWHPVNDGFRAIARSLGYGSYEVVDYRFEKDVEDFLIENISEPYSVPLACGDSAAAFEILFGCDLGTAYREMAPDLYEITCYVSNHPEILKGRLKFKQYELKQGDINLERCKSCGGPAALTDYTWYQDRGVIVNDYSFRRMVLTGIEVDAIFDELEAEVGDIIPEAVIEAQRRFVRTGFYNINGMGTRSMRDQLALRGLGNILELKSEERGLYMRLENACIHLMLVGLVQGLYENTYDTSSHLEWELSESGDLEIIVTPLMQRQRSASTA